MSEKLFDYQDGAQTCEGFVASPTKEGKQPAVLVVHSWVGLGNVDKEAARHLSSLGYVGFAVDVYGKGKRDGVDGMQAKDLMQPFLDDRVKLEKRLIAAVEAARALPNVDASRIAILGFCFGGLCALDVARSGHEAIKGAISFHGNLTPPGGAQKPIGAKVLVCHGFDDPMVKPEAVLAFTKEMNEAKADWQVHAYGHTMHGFTNPTANNPAHGVQYNETASRRAWAAADDFLAEALG
ncbi:MAG: dienelactone hydrolase family protein [Proteobacteria bacterium]|nr:MAG: dienelactone hydrolase family protein [Pseudomonadota bacterium]